jgi:hypothetical protein
MTGPSGGNAPWTKAPQPGSRGLFPSSTRQRLTLRNASRRKAAAKLDAFAELLAEGHKPGAAAVILGHLPDYGRVLLQRIIKRLGPQAR